MKKILGFMGIVLIILITIQIYLLSGFSTETFKSININFMVEVFSIIATVFILNGLIKKHENKKQVDIYVNTLSTRHEILTNELSSTFIHFIQKESGIGDLEDVLKNLDQKITSRFLKEKYQVAKINENDIFNPKLEYVTYQVFCKYHFKDKLENSIAQYLNRYISIVPNEVLTSLFKIDDLLKSNMLSTPNDFGVAIDISNAEFNPSDFVDTLSQIGNEILKLKKITT